MTSSDEMDEAIASLEQMQTDVRYRQAQATLDQLLDRLDLSPEESADLQADIDHLRQMQQRLEQGVIQLAVFGLVGRGKSSLLNALLGQPAFTTGPLHGVTQEIDRADWLPGMVLPEGGVQRLALNGLSESRVELIDTPGLDEISGEARAVLAEQVAQQVD
ncbi:MAG: GTPase, partial [Cyanobacteria bacterium P01_A01_bin.135]